MRYTVERNWIDVLGTIWISKGTSGTVQWMILSSLNLAFSMRRKRWGLILGPIGLASSMSPLNEAVRSMSLTWLVLRHHDAQAMLRLHTPLFDLADDASNGGGATPPAAAPVSVENPAVAVSPSGPSGAPPPKPSVIATATALLRGANANAATVAALRADVTARDTTIADLTAQLAARDSTIASQLVELQTFRTQSADLQTAVAALEARNVNVQTEVIHQLAAAGLPEAQLPHGSADATIAADPAQLWEQAAAEGDPVKKGLLVAQAMKITAGKVHGSN